MLGTKHISVLTNEVLDFLKVKPKKWYLDATFGGGGHSREILKRGGRVIGLDRDLESINRGKSEFFKMLDKDLILVSSRFSELKSVLKELEIGEIAGCVFDLGLSSDQLSDRSRGFSFMEDGPLDMRMDQTLKVTAGDLINGLTPRELESLFIKFGEVGMVRRVVAEIVRRRQISKLETTRELAELIESVFPRVHYPRRSEQHKKPIHPATQFFQALRIVVNDELGELEQGLQNAVQCLSSQGRIVVISFHSLEDRIVKNFFKDEPNLKILTKKVVVPNEDEINLNKRSRSAKLRAAEKK